jgi:membrane protease subunit (stomatin/prohibitin family)
MPRIIDVIEFPDETGRELVKRLPEYGPGDFRYGSQVIVRESQTAVFFRDGKAMDVLGPGRHTISTSNIPILASLIGLATSGKTPFPAEVVFVSMRQFLDQKWGTPEPIVFRDSELGMARLRAFGTYGYQIKNPGTFVTRIVGQRGIFTTTQVENYFRSIIVQKFTDYLGEQKRSLFDLPSQYNEISMGLTEHLAEDFDAIGLRLMAFYVTAITPTEETAKAIDERAAMGAIGDMNAYMKFKAARALGDAANSPGEGGAGAGLGLGAGIGLGAGLAGAIQQAFQQPQAAPASAPAAPASAPAPSGGPLTREQIQEAIDALDLRFSKGEISEEAYNRLMKKWEDRLKEMGG